ncbi:DUF3427 domain-containing protein [Flaviflexus sp.]|uniref:DUF3427 domain-containing protein n=1 Tax=Flaviflexus sp. TaxID=1969482 RepID=UPI003F914D3F
MESYEEGALPYGLYELVRSAKLPKDRFPVDANVEFEPVEEAERIRILTTYVAQRLEHRLLVADKRDRVDLLNRALQGIDPDDRIEWDDAKGKFSQLVSLSPPEKKAPVRPGTALSEVSLLTNNAKEPALNKEIARELASADRVDLICSFLKVSGVNLIRTALEQLRDRRVPVRIVATTYMGATDARAVSMLHDLGAEVKISYQNMSTRLHAKAWLFERDSGFSTAYVGSSNLSAAAMTEGLEWNVRLSSILTPGVLSQFRAAFDAYWQDPEFVTYEPEQFDELDRALERAQSATGKTKRLAAIDTSFLDVYPRPHQSIMLDHLSSERAHGRHQNLIVAATGTGKTILSALDYRNLRDVLEAPRLLFIAHRREILEQARSAFRAVLRRNDFGELLVGGIRPERWEHVFASIQTLSGDILQQIPREHFDVVIVDEFHHASAKTYRRVMEWLQPRELIGLTATPERGDGTNVADEFFAGRIATELRLWDALDADLLVPFHYFGIWDETDLSGLEVRQGNYESAALETIYTEGAQAEARLRVIFDELEKKVADPRRMKALGFCATKAHAKFMAKKFNEANIPAAVLLGDHDAEERSVTIRRLVDDKNPLSIIFTVDIFNEGVDIPELDTILMLRPTQSPTLFQQQLGRGLRRAPRKAVLTVLDFVGNQNKLFRLDTKYVIFARDGHLKDTDIKDEFPDLPGGCAIVLDRVTQERILSNIRRSLQVGTEPLLREVRDFFAKQEPGATAPFHRLGDFLSKTGRDFDHLYGRLAKTSVDDKKSSAKRTWTYLTAYSGVEQNLHQLFTQEDFLAINNRIHVLRHVNDAVRSAGYLELLRGRATEADLNIFERRLAWMLIFSFWNNGKFPWGERKFSLDEALALLRKYPSIAGELEQMWNIVADRDRQVARPVESLEGESPLLTHGHYTREELYAGLGMHEKDTRPTPNATREGVIESAALDAVALLVTLEKTEKHYTPQTMYKDYAVTSNEFAWDSQNNTTPDSRRGQMFQGQGDDLKQPLLFVRRTKTSRGIPGAAEPYTFLGPVAYVSHEGSQPMHITWQLERSMPAELFQIARAVA